MVRSEDSHGNASCIVTTILEPYNADSKKLLSYQVAQDSAQINCSPSYAFLDGSPTVANIVLEIEMLIIQTFLDQGYYVVTPDYEGLNAAFTAGVQSGQATLNSLRAALSSGNITGIDPDAKIGMFGYSGGTIASGWAAELQPSYAKELNGQIVGVALGALVSNITATAEAVEGTIFAGLSTAGITGLGNEYPEVAETIKDQMTSEQHEKKFSTAEDHCLIDMIFEFLFAHVFTGPTRFCKDGYDVFTFPKIKPILAENTLAYKNGTYPTAPIFMYHGIADEIAPIVGAERYYNNYCQWGIKSLEYAVDQTAGHITEVFKGMPGAVAWMQDRFNGVAPVDGCKRTERASNHMYPGTNETISEIVQATIEDLLGQDLGPGAHNDSVIANIAGDLISDYLINF